jgi:hypothetical protein
LIETAGLGNICPVGYIYPISPNEAARWNYYGLEYDPSHVTDGIMVRVGGGYSGYYDDYTARHAVSAPVAVTFVDKSLAASTAYVKVRVTLEQSIPTGHTIYVELWEDDVVVGGTYGSTPARAYDRAMATTALTVTSVGQTQDFEHTFTLDAGWKRADLGITAWVQGDAGDKEVHNAAAAMISDTAIEPSSLGRVKAGFK